MAAVVASTLSVRHNDLGFIYKFAGKKETSKGQFESSWSQRLIFAYVGGRIFLDHPLTGTGWWGDPPPSTFAKLRAGCAAEVPRQPGAATSRPTDRPFIPQQTYDEVLYELGLDRRCVAPRGLRRRGPDSLRDRASGGHRDARSTTCRRSGSPASIGALAGEGLFGGIPLTTLLWLTLGVAAYRSTTRGDVNIVHAIARLNVGGAALSVLELAAGQQRRGHDVLVVAGTIPPGERSMEHVADELGVPYLHVPVLQRELAPRADAEAVRTLRRVIREPPRDRPPHAHGQGRGDRPDCGGRRGHERAREPSSTPTTAMF